MPLDLPRTGWASWTTAALLDGGATKSAVMLCGHKDVGIDLTDTRRGLPIALSLAMAS